MGTIIINTSVDDLRSSLKCSIKHRTIESLEQNIILEQAGQNRSSVIKLLQQAIRAKKAGKETI